MALITDTYTKYKITQTLQEHQLRVAAVAKQICDNLTISIDTTTVIQACLLHDMGNILKFVFDGSPPEWFQPEGEEYWKNVKQKFHKKYGDDEHQASLEIAKEIGVSHKVLECIDCIDFDTALENVKRTDIEPKICDYADLRVGPSGVVSVDQRLEEGRKRYKDRPDKWIKPERWQELSQACHALETQVFEHSKIKPSDITDESIAPIMEQLRTYEIYPKPL